MNILSLMIAIEAMQIFEFRIQELALRFKSYFFYCRWCFSNFFVFKNGTIQTFKKILKLYNKINNNYNIYIIFFNIPTFQPFQNHEVILNLQNVIKNTII